MKKQNSKRIDDNFESFKKRMIVLNQETRPIYQIFEKNKKLIEIDARPAPENIIANFLSLKEINTD